MVSCPLLPLSVGTDIPRPPKAATITPCHGEHPPSREGLSRLQRLRRCIGGTTSRQQTGKKKGRAVRAPQEFESSSFCPRFFRGKSPVLFARLLWFFLAGSAKIKP